MSNPNYTTVSKHFKNFSLSKKPSKQASDNQLDFLTKLHTYSSFTKEAKLILENSDKSTLCALLLIDIDDFGKINEQFGIIFADTLLIELAARLKHIGNSNNLLLGRYGADEFIILVKDAPSISFIQELVQYIHSTIQNIHIGSHNNPVWTSCIGSAIYPTNSDSFETLYHQANIALYHAKSHGKNKFCFYSEKLASLAVEELMQQKPSSLIPESPFLEHSDVDTDIISGAIDILFGTNSSDNSIYMVLSLIGLHYNLDRISLLETGEETGTFDIIHNWQKNSYYSTASIFEHNKEFFIALHSKCIELSTDDIFSCSSLKNYPELIKLCSSSDSELPSALFQYSFKINNTLPCAVCASISSREHIWTNREVNSLALLFKMISNYIQHSHFQNRVSFVSQYDALTKVFNFTTFISKANQLIASNPGKNYFVIFSDIHRFMLFNDTYGYTNGNKVLKGLAGLLTDEPHSCLVGRVNSDKFVSLFEWSSSSDITGIVESILSQSKSIHCEDGTVHKIVLLLGISLVENTNSVLSAIDRANIAKKSIQDYKISNYRFFDENMHRSLLKKQKIENAMEDALANEDFLIYYQSKINVHTKELIGAEALVRWNFEGNQMLLPSAFIPVFEENGFIIALDYYVLEHVCKWLRELIDNGVPVVPVSVNFSRMHFKTGELPLKLQETLKRYNIPSNLIEIEITESALGSCSSTQLKILNELHELGLKLSLDDFGSGLSSLNVLRDMPFDILKIDKEFLHSKTTTEKERVVITNIVRMASDLDMGIICEGVETIDHEGLLKQIGCSAAQGYYYARPIPEADFVSRYLQ